MGKYMVMLVIVGLFILGLGINCFADELTWENISREHADLRTALVSPDNPSVIYIGSDKGIFKSEDGGDSWRNSLSLKGQNRSVNFLLFAPKDKNSLYAATGNGLFCSTNQGKNWKRIFQGKNYLENECTTLAVASDAIYLGTKQGLFVSKDRGRSWHKETAKLGNSHILAIVSNLKEPDYIYVACIDGVFRTADYGQVWERTFVAHPVEDGLETEEETEDKDEQERFSGIRYISCDPNNLSYLYLSTSTGVYKSQDRGITWQPLSNYGLLDRDVKFLLVAANSNIYAAGKSGVFEYRDRRWQELSLRLSAEKFEFLAQDKQGNLYAASNKGLFKANRYIFNQDEQVGTIELYCKDEPKINEIQQAAIKYAEVGAEKIKQWRKQVAKKALLPKINVGLDRNTTDLWHWETGSTTKNEDDILRRGNDSVDWSVSLAWDLGELLWNNDQTSIDVRSRLMVQLRDDILDEVTKLYFERIRTKMELDNLSIEDRKKRFEKELKLEELTASLDAFTGGYLSTRLAKSR